MIVLVVLSILVAVSYPAYQSQMQENRRSDGKKILLEMMHEQQKFHVRNATYTTDLVSGGVIGLDYDDAGGGQVKSENGFYLISAAVCDASTAIAECVLLTAEAQTGQISDGDISYNSRNTKDPPTHW